MNKSPFFIVDDFLSPLMCEDIVARSFFEFPNVENGTVVKSITQNVLTQNRVLPLLEDLIEDLEDYYNYEHGGILPFNIEYYPEKCKQEGLRAENSFLKDNKWMRSNDHDFTGIIFLKTESSDRNFDESFEIYGSKLEFPNHQFGFVPSRGRLVVFPSAPNFTNVTISPKIGDLYQIRFQLVGMKPYNYDMNEFPGNYKTWFKNNS
ncbi:hypothetical protein Xoosp13_315 [Xanthomonas phage Xoo-sp13]|nr:hypothetical protein Xoosp13_315 [Xanthomonas phage Xoo-sp13]